MRYDPGSDRYLEVDWDSAFAGIGRDDDATLYQKQSQSIDPNSMVAIGLTSIAASNLLNANTFSTDKMFEMWGSDNAAITFGTAAISGVRRAASIESAAIARCTTRKSVHQ